MRDRRRKRYMHVLELTPPTQSARVEQRLTCWSRIYPSPWPRWHPEMDDPRGPAALVEVPWHSASQTAFWGSLTRTRDYLLSNPRLLDASPPSPPALPVD